MATPVKMIIDSMLLTLQDYKLQKLKTINVEAYDAYLEAFVLKGRSQFTKCFKVLDYDAETHEFIADLDYKEIDILADYATIEWFRKEVNNTTSFNGMLSNAEFKRYSEAQNLKEKKDYLIFINEKVNQDVSDYILSHKESWQDAFKM